MMKTFSTVIVEDDALHRDHLVDLLHKGFSGIQIVKVCKSGEEAIEHIPLLSPDLLFLDIDLGDMDAFELLNKIKTNHLKIIFTTAYQDWAVKAFKVNALHYLLKPVMINDLREAISRVEQEHQLTDIKEIAGVLNQYNNRMLAIREKNAVQYLCIDKINYIEADESYTVIHYSDNLELKTILSSNNLSHYEQELQPNGFLRIHKSYLVNNRQIRKYDRSKATIELVSGESIPVSRQKRFLLG